MALRASPLAAGGEDRVDPLHPAVEHLASSPAPGARAGADRSRRRVAPRRPPRRSPSAPALSSGARVPRHHVGDELTPSERRIVDMAAAGMSNPQIAQALFVTTKTVESHLGRAYLKLGVKSRHELTRVPAPTGKASE